MGAFSLIVVINLLNRMGQNVRTKIDIVYSKNLDSSILQVFQFPFVAARNLDSAHMSVRSKQKHSRYEFDIFLETENPNYSKNRASSFTHALSDQNIERSMRRTRYMSKKINDRNQFCVGVFTGGKLHLTPVSGVMQLIPGYDHIDSIDKARRKKEKEASAGQKLDESSSQDESTDKNSARKAQAITVRFGKNESEESKAKRKQTYPYLKEMWDADPWQPLTFLNFNPRNYLESMLPQDDKTDKRKSDSQPYAPSSELNVESLKTMPLLNKIVAILKNANIVKYSQLITLLGNRVEKENVVSCLKKAAVLVRGCWVINSETLYPEKSVSSACGISAELMRRGRDYILWRMNRHGFVMRKEMCSHTKLPGEEVRGILESISQLNSETGWEFLYPIDTYFLESNRAIRDEYTQFWYRAGKDLCTDLGLNFKHDFSPKRADRTRNISTDSSGAGSPSPASEKRRRRRNSSRTSPSAQDEIKSLVHNLTSSDSYRRTHSSPSESSATYERFLSDPEIKAMQNRMEDFLLVKVSDFRPIISRITGKNMLTTDYSKAARDMDFFEVPIKCGASKSEIIMAYCVRPTEFSDDKRLLLARCAAFFSSKGYITKQSVPKLIENINVDKSTVEKVLKQLCWLKDKQWMPRFLGVDGID